MSNNEIIMANTVFLINEGKLTEDDTIHTYEGWKSLGFQVKKGEKSTIKFAIWKQVTKKRKDKETEQTKFILVNTAWFTQMQVEKA